MEKERGKPFSLFVCSGRRPFLPTPPAFSVWIDQAQSNSGCLPAWIFLDALFMGLFQILDWASGYNIIYHHNF
jgi:hypothetical protein